MQITIRSPWLLRLMGFEPSGIGRPLVGMSARMWLAVIRALLTRKDF